MMTPRNLLLAAVAIVAVLVVADVFNVWLIGDLASVILGFLGALVGVVSGVLGAIVGAIWFVLTSIVGAVGAVIGSGIGLIPVLVATAIAIAAAVVAITVVVAGAEAAARKIREHRFETLLSTFGTIAGLAVDLAAKAAALGSPTTEILATAYAFLLILAGVFIRRGGLANICLAVVFMVSVPVILLWRIVSQRPLGNLAEALGAVPIGSVAGLALIAILAVGATGLALREKGA